MGYSVPTSTVPGSSLSSRHYPQATLVSMTRKLVGFPSPDQVSCDYHPLFDDLHPLASCAKAFYNTILSLEEDIFENC